MTDPTYCQDCDHVEAASRKLTPHLWLCRKHKRVFNDSFVTRTAWVKADPFLRCRDTNAGACPLFEPLRKPAEGGEHDH